MIKNFLGVHGQKWVWLVWSQGWKMNIWNKGIFSYWYKCRKAKSGFNYFWMGLVKNGLGFLVHETLISVVRMNLWIELIFRMLIVMQKFFVGLISYSLFDLSYSLNAGDPLHLYFLFYHSFFEFYVYQQK